jgi:diacylglycerol kinase (CTP)
MAPAATLRTIPTPASVPSGRASSPSPSLRANSPPSRRASASPTPHHSSRAARRASFDKENVGGAFYSVMETANHKILENGHGPLAPSANGHAGSNGYDHQEAGRARRESSASEDDIDHALRRRHGSVPRSPRATPRSPPPAGVATLPTIVAHVEMDTSAIVSDDGAHSPPPAPSAMLAHSGPADDTLAPTGLRRRRRSSSVHVKPPPGVTPTKAVDWEIPRKAFHSSIGESYSEECFSALARCIARPRIHTRTVNTY